MVPVAEQRARQRQLDLIRIARGLTSAEPAEADRLAAREQMRAWRTNQRLAEQALAARQSAA